MILELIERLAREAEKRGAEFLVIGAMRWFIMVTSG
jgi:hypothetical protein